jgi:hypothetical protein
MLTISLCLLFPVVGGLPLVRDVGVVRSFGVEPLELPENIPLLN